MCGRYTLYQLSQFTDLFPWIRPPDVAPPSRYNIAPTNAIAVVPNTPDPQIDFFHWGLIPSWASDLSIGNRMINARAESLAEKPAFRTALKRRRCLIPADGFYEWKKHADGKTKTPMYIRMKDHKPFTFAGLWETWHAPDGSTLPSCTIITTAPNDLMKSIHDRMPVILSPDEYHRWLTPEELGPASVRAFLDPYPADLMEARPVSRLVNSPANDTPQCITGLTEETKGEPPAQAKRPTRRKKSDDAQPGLF